MEATNKKKEKRRFSFTIIAEFNVTGYYRKIASVLNIIEGV
jgi:hypothetical protein